MQSKELTIHGVDFIVEYSFTKGYPATLEEPGYDDEIEIISIKYLENAFNLYQLHDTAGSFGLTPEQYLESDILYDAALEILYEEDKELWHDYDDQYGTDEFWDDCYCNRDD